MNDFNIGEQSLLKETDQIKIDGYSIASTEHPERNEDRFFILNSKKGTAVFDGVGGYAGGEEAASIANTRIKKGLEELPPKLDYNQTQKRIEGLLQETHQVIYNQAQNKNNRMSTTAVLVFLWESPDGTIKPIIANVGDSRVYRLRSGQVEQLTLDDSFARSVSRDENTARQLQKKLSNVLSEDQLKDQIEQAAYYQRNVINQCLGKQESKTGNNKPIEIHFYESDFQFGDQLILCSDGLSDNLTDTQIQNIMTGKLVKPTHAQELVAAAQTISLNPSNFRQKTDDITAVVIDYQQPEEVRKVEKKLPTVGDQISYVTDKGFIFTDWQIIEVNQQTGQVTAEKDSQKVIIAPDKLSRVRVQKDKERLDLKIEEVDNFGDLFAVIKKIGGVRGSKETYSPDDLTRKINEVAQGKADLGTITRSSGLRDKVQNLLDSQNIPYLNA